MEKSKFRVLNPSTPLFMHLECPPYPSVCLNLPSLGTSLVGQWLRLHAPNAGRPMSNSWLGTRVADMNTLHAAKSSRAPLKIPHAVTKTWRSSPPQKKEYFFFNEKKKSTRLYHPTQLLLHSSLIPTPPFLDLQSKDLAPSCSRA